METEDGSATGSVLMALVRDPSDQRAWNAFVSRYAPLIHSWCRRCRLQEADAEDVTQEVLKKLYKNIGAFKYDAERGTFRAWLKTVTRNAWRDFVDSRRQREGSAVGGSDHTLSLQTIEARDDLAMSIEAEHEADLLATAAKLVRFEVSTRDWEIFQALAVDDRPGAEVAKAHGMKVAAVYVVRGRVQRRLQDAIRRLDSQQGEA
jgi:RNA polymerase sigma factor (sigma-70 family)